MASIPQKYMSGSITLDTQSEANFDMSSFQEDMKKELAQYIKIDDLSMNNLNHIQNVRKKARNLEESHHIIGSYKDILFEVRYKEKSVKKTPIIKRFGINPYVLKKAPNYYQEYLERSRARKEIQVP